MKIKIDIDDGLDEPEVLIRTPHLDTQIQALQAFLSQSQATPLVFYQDSREFFLDVMTILFFETQGAKVFAHSQEDSYEVHLKLYELEERLPTYFCRVAKSTIVNCKAIYSLDRSFSGTSTVSFHQTHKQVHVSRHYYQLLKERLREVR